MTALILPKFTMVNFQKNTEQSPYQDIKLNHEFHEDSMTKFKNKNNLIDLCDKINISDPKFNKNSTEYQKIQNCNQVLFFLIAIP